MKSPYSLYKYLQEFTKQSSFSIITRYPRKGKKKMRFHALYKVKKIVYNTNAFL